MSRRYSPDHKALILKILAAYNQDITITCAFTGVPERTLRDWQAEQRRLAARARTAAAKKSTATRRQ